MASIRLAETDEEIQRCFPVMAELRPHLQREEFVARVRRQREQGGYRLIFLEDNGGIQAVAGVRICESLSWGRFYYVDDLITTEKERSRGLGQQLFDWLLADARRNRCQQFHLDSGVQRFAAHGFYLKNRLHITCHHFGRELT